MATGASTRLDGGAVSQVGETLPRQTVLLRVGEERFIVKPETLSQESIFFEALFSGRWSQAEPDGSYFIDYDPAVFKHILRYFRAGNYPLCLDKDQKLDHAAYADILTAADYFGIAGLTRWIQEKRYEGAIATEFKITFLAGGFGSFQTSSQDVEVTEIEREEVFWTCPMDIYEHDTEVTCRTQRCQRLAIEVKPWRSFYGKRYVRGVRVKERTTKVRHEVLMKI